MAHRNDPGKEKRTNRLINLRQEQQTVFRNPHVFYEGRQQRRAGFLLTFLAAEKSEAPAGEP